MREHGYFKDDPLTSDQPTKQTVATCKSCKAPVLWIYPKGYKPQILDLEPVYVWIKNGPGFDQWEIKQARVSHFETCPHAKEWKQKNKFKTPPPDQQLKLFGDPNHENTDTEST